MNKYILFFFILFSLNLVMAGECYTGIEYCNPNIPFQNSIQSISTSVNNNTLFVNNSQYLQGLTPQQVADLYNELDPNYFSNPLNYYNSTTLPVTVELWNQSAGTLYPATPTDRVLIGGATDDSTSALQVNGNSHIIGNLNVTGNLTATFGSKIGTSTNGLEFYTHSILGDNFPAIKSIDNSKYPVITDGLIIKGTGVYPVLYFISQDDSETPYIEMANGDLIFNNGDVSENARVRANGDFWVSHNLKVGDNVTATKFIGNGSLLTGIVGDNSTWNQTYANTLYARPEVNNNFTVNQSFTNINVLDVNSSKVSSNVVLANVGNNTNVAYGFIGAEGSGMYKSGSSIIIATGGSNNAVFDSNFGFTVGGNEFKFNRNGISDFSLQVYNSGTGGSGVRESMVRMSNVETNQYISLLINNTKTFYTNRTHTEIYNNLSVQNKLGISGDYNCTSYPNVTITGGIITSWSC